MQNKKLLLPAIVIVALLIGYGGTFAVASLTDRDKDHEATSHGHDSKSAYADSPNHGGGQNANITADASIKDVKADKNIDLLSDKASPG